MKKLFLILNLLTAILLFASCSDDNTVANNNYSTEPWQTDDVKTYNVVYTDKTTIIEANEIINLISEDSSKYIYTFDKSFSKASDLKIGDVILIHGKSLRKVKKLTTNGTGIVVETNHANLNEAIKSGKISWDVGCDFTSEAKPIIRFHGKDYYPRVLSDNLLDWEFTIGAYSYHIEMELNGGSAKVKFELEKEIGGSAKGKFIAEGVIEKFRSKSEMEFDNSALTSFDHENDGMQGDLKLSLVVAASGNDALNLELPVVLFKYPFLVGPIPCVINVKAQIVINAVVPFDGSAQVSTKFKYNSQTGFHYDGHDFSAKANVGPFTIDKDVAETGASGAIGVNFGIGFPRLEVGLFDDVIVPWIQTAFLISGDFTFTPPCRQARASFIGGYGIDFSFLGLSASFTRNLWQKDKILLKSGECE